MATDVSDTLPRSMSLSRRYLSLPQELTGCSLPPQIPGKQLGFVMLCVAHILPSAVSSSPLPRVSLVRVRWWGEKTPGSLFRPSLLSEDPGGNADAPDSPHRIIAMKYPVNVRSNQLLEYFQDMGHLTLDVIDRDSRRKVGECLLPLDFAKENSIMTAEEKLVALRRDNVLCEIDPCDGEKGEVVGYLAVSFDVKWTDNHKQVDTDANGVEVEELAPSSSLSNQTEISDLKETKEKVQAKLKLIENVEQHHDVPVKKEVNEIGNDEVCDNSQRLQQLLKKGKALQQSMERAVIAKNDEEIEAEDGDFFAASRYAFDGESEETHTVANYFSGNLRHLEFSTLDDEHSREYLTSKVSSDNVVCAKQGCTSTTQLPDANLLSEKINLVITFESLELEQNFVNNQLRQLRDSASATNRYRPIQISVSIDELSSLLDFPHSAEKDPIDIYAFAVSTSLRKRHWQLGCSSTMSLIRPSPCVELDCDKNKRLRFYVRCENKVDERRNKRRREHNRFSSLSKRILLEGSVGALQLLAIAKQSNKTWATTIELIPKSDDNQVGKVGNGPSRRKTKTRKQPTNKLQSVGKLNVRFAFHTVTLSEQNAACEKKSNADSEMSLSSISSISVDQTEVAVDDILTADTSLHSLQRGGQSKVLYEQTIEGTKSLIFLQFAVMLEAISSVAVEKLRDGKEQLRETAILAVDDSRGDKNTFKDASISLQYTVSSNLTRMSPTYERTVMRRLNPSQWLNSPSLLRADFGRTTHIFQTTFVDDSSDCLSNGHLIFETWIQLAKNTERRLVGLAKVPLRALATLFSKDKVDLLRVSEKSFPFVDVGGSFPIENPFTGHLSGYLRVRVCIGTAEQLVMWVKTIQTVVKLQSIIRGVLFRKHCYTASRTTPKLPSTNLTTQSHSIISSIEDCGSDVQSRVPGHTPINEAHDVISYVSSCCKEGTCGEQPEWSRDDEEAFEAALTNDYSLILRKIRFELRESWRSATQSLEDKEKKHRGWTLSPLLGCELQGQLILTGNRNHSGKVNDLPFALWWDAADRNLNSCFMHTFQARSRVNEDLALVGPQSQVLFALHVENGFFGTQSRDTITGEARLNLYEKLKRHVTEEDGIAQNAEEEGSYVLVDIPIVWDRGGNSHQTLPASIPLTISYHLSQSTNSTALTVVNATSLEDAYSFDSSDEAGHQFDANTNDIPERCLIPASLVLSFHLLSMEDFQGLLDETSRQLMVNSLASKSKSSAHLYDILKTKYDARLVCFDTTITIGKELHELERIFRQKDNDSSIRVFMENGKWYKRWRSHSITIPTTSDNRTETFENVHKSICMPLNPDTVATLQQDCAHVAVLLLCNICCQPHELGCVNIPLAAVLYRPQGVRGMFPIRVQQGFSAARVGVHCFVDHSDVSIASTGAFQEKISTPLMSPTSPDEINCTTSEMLSFRPMRSCEVCIEEARNLVAYKASAPTRVYVTFQVIKQSANEEVQANLINSNKRTKLDFSTDSKWNYRDILDVGDVNWQHCLLNVSVWEDNSTNSIGYAPGGESLHLTQRESDMLVGSVLIDLSLFNRGWRDIDGWYHIKNLQHQTQGQVKVHVRNLSVEDTISSAEPLFSSWNTENCADVVGNFDAATTVSTLDSAVQAVYLASAEVEERLARLHSSNHEVGIATGNTGANVDELFDDRNAARDDATNISNFSETMSPTKQELTLEADAKTADDNTSADCLSGEAKGYAFTSHAFQAKSDDYDALKKDSCVSEASETSAVDVELKPTLQADDIEVFLERSGSESEDKTFISPQFSFECTVREDDEVADVSDDKLVIEWGEEGKEDSTEVKFQTPDPDLESFDIDCLWKVPDVQSKARKQLQKNDVGPANTVLECNAEENDVSCEKGTASSETRSMSDDDTKDLSRLSGVVASSHNRERQYADKAVQVHSFELGYQVVEMGVCAAHTSPLLDLKEKIVIDVEVTLNNRFENHIETIDVGCDAMETLNIISLEHSRSEKENSQPLLSTKRELDELRVNVSQESNEFAGNPCVISDIKSPRSNRSVEQNESGKARNFDIALQNEKLDLMYDMLRDMRESYLAAKAASLYIQESEKPDDDRLITEQSRCTMDDNRETNAKHTSCPNSPISKVPTKRYPWVKVASESASATFKADKSDEFSGLCSSCPNSPIANALNSPQIQDASFNINVTESTSLMTTDAFVHTTQKYSCITQVHCQNLETKKDVSNDEMMVHTSRKGSDESKIDSNTIRSTQRLSLSNINGPSTQYSNHKNKHEEEMHRASMHSLFPRDSETERIARIMQGSMKYWVIDDRSSSSDDQFEEDESESDCYF